MSRIQFKETTMVQPAELTPHTTIWISNLDMLWPMNHHMLVNCFFEWNKEPTFFDSAVLKDALSRALVLFYPMAGRLKKNGNRIEINCNGEGVLFIDAEFDGRMDELGDFSPKTDLSFAPKVDYSHGISTFPLYVVQVIRFKCGGVCFGTGSEHHLCDGMSALHFLNTWSDIARGLDVTVSPFVDRRAVMSARNPPRPTFDHIEYQPPPSMKIPTHSTPEPLVYKKFKLTTTQLTVLKASCEGYMGRSYYSKFEVVAGHGWRCITKARELPEDQLTKVYIPVNGRSRLQPPLPQGYIGNVLFWASPIATASELGSNPLAFSVGKIHDAIARIDHEYAISSLDYLELQEDLSSMATGPHTFKCPNLLVNGWNNLPLYDVDFGWGRPVYVGHGIVQSEGKTFVMASPVKDGSIVYAVTLPEDQMRRLEVIFYEDL